MTFSEKDLKQIKERGGDPETVQGQLRNFESGFPYIQLTAPATKGNGIHVLSPEQQNEYIALFRKTIPGKKLLKFVPASGAASRMFKKLFAFMESYKGTEEEYEELKKDQGLQSLFSFFKRIEDFAFFGELKEVMNKDGLGLEECLLKREYAIVLEYLLTEKGLDYGSLPKGLLKFHSYTEGVRTPVEEHLVEGAAYCQQADKSVNLHLTVSPEHEKGFEQKIAEAATIYADKLDASFRVSFSQQKPSTDTIAVDLENKPFREDDESLLFRPAGHGALIENLNDMNADLIFIKNIDNVVPDSLKEDTVRFKQVLAGVLMQLQNKVFEYLEMLEKGNLDDSTLAKIAKFLEEELCTRPSETFSQMGSEQKAAYLRQKLHRPLRACGMVKNEGEPGGGPFWAINPDGSISLQIVESAQIDPDNPQQQALVKEATHFNPVDLVCATKDHKGKSFDLLEYRDPKTGFISQKSKSGRDLKAQELPGLWNGAMSDWNTVFVEVPISTFNPVKTVNDLLREQHQA